MSQKKCRNVKCRDTLSKVISYQILSNSNQSRIFLSNQKKTLFVSPIIKSRIQKVAVSAKQKKNPLKSTKKYRRVGKIIN